MSLLLILSLLSSFLQALGPRGDAGVFTNCSNSRFRSSRQRCSMRPATLVKKGLWHRCFPVNFAKFLRTLYFMEQLWWLLLIVVPVRTVLWWRVLSWSSEDFFFAKNFRQLTLRLLMFFMTKHRCNFSWRKIVV